MDISADGKTLVVANNYNDSVSVIDTAMKVVRYEHDLRPFLASNEAHNGGVGGTFPYAVVLKGNGTAYVSSDRDREVIVVDVSSLTQGKLIKRIKLDGNGLGMTLDESQSKLYVAQDNADQVAVIDTAEHINLNTAFQRSMSDVFDIKSSGKWTFAAEASTVLQGTSLALAQNGKPVVFAAGPLVTPKHDAVYWDAVTAGFDFSEADQVPPAQFNRVLWTGLMGGKPYPVMRGQVSGTKD
jgi:DNA-binding beta-propeller fold protein YncE